jgi:hypothetical protein
MSTKSSRKGQRTSLKAPQVHRPSRRILGVESLAGFVARRLHGERRRAVVLGRSLPAAPFPIHRLAGTLTRRLGDPWRSHRLPAHDLATAISRKLGCRCGKIALPTVLRAIQHELHRQEAKRPA